MSAASSTVSTSVSPTAPTTTRDSDEARGGGGGPAPPPPPPPRFALTRLIQGIFVVWVAVTITFIGLHLAQRLRRAR